MSIRSKLNGLMEVLQFTNRWQLLVNLLFFRKTNLTVYRLGKVEFIVDVDGCDNNGVRHAIASKMYRELLPKCLWDSEVSVLDLGSNAGGFPMLLEIMGISVKRLVCVEMNQNTFRRLKFNISRNLDCNATFINAAVCGHRQTLDLVLGNGDTGDSIYRDSACSVERGVRRQLVEGVLFDDIYEQEFKGYERIDLCKMDVEGAEYEILSRPGHQSLKRFEWLLVEIHDACDAEKTNQFLVQVRDLGFVEVGRHGNVAIFQNQAEGICRH